MKANFEKDLQNIFKEYGESPSPDCWSKLSNRLDIAYNQSTPAGGNASSVLTKVFKSTIGKVSISAAVIATVGTTVYLLNNTSKEDNIVQNQITIETPHAIIDTTNDTVLVVEEITNGSLPENRKATTKLDNNKTTAVAPSITEVENNKTSLHTTETFDFSVVNQNDKQQEIIKDKTTQPTKKEINNKTSITKEESVEKEKTTENKIRKVVEEEEEEIMQPRFDIPNIFTPNGDNINDYFVIEAVDGVTNGHLYIYSVNGRVLYEKENYQNDFYGEYLPDGLYLYIYKFIYKNKEFIRKGMLTIKRD